MNIKGNSSSKASKGVERMGIVSWIRSSFCINSAFQFDATPKLSQSRRNISPRFFRNQLESPYLRYSNEESFELTISEPLKYSSKMTQTDNPPAIQPKNKLSFNESLSNDESLLSLPSEDYYFDDDFFLEELPPNLSLISRTKRESMAFFSYDSILVDESLYAKTPSQKT